MKIISGDIMNKDDIRMILDEMHLLSPEELTSKAKR